MGDDASSNATAALSQQQIPQLLEPLSPAYAIIAASSTTEPAAFEFPSTAKRPLQVRSSELEGKPGFEGVVIHNEPNLTISSTASTSSRSFLQPDIKSKPSTPTSPSSSIVKLRGSALSSSDAASAPPSNSLAPRGRKRVAPTLVDSMVKRQKTTQGGRGRKSKDDAFNDPEAILGPDRSPLYDEALNLQAILEHPKAQAILNSTETFLSDISNVDLQRTIADFKEDGRASRHDAQWLTEANEASGRRMAGDFDPYLAAVFTDTWGEEDEALSDSDGELDEKDKDRMAIDPEPSATKYGDDDAGGGGNMASVPHTNGHTTSVSDQSTHTVNEPIFSMDAHLNAANEADNLDEMPDTDSSNNSEPGVDALVLDETSDEAPPASKSESAQSTASPGHETPLPETEDPPNAAAGPCPNRDMEVSIDAESSNGAGHVTKAAAVDASMNSGIPNNIRQASSNVHGKE